MIALTENIKNDIKAAYERLGKAEFNRLFQDDFDGYVNLTHILERYKVITPKLAERFKQIVDLDRYKDASHFRVSTAEHIESFSGIPDVVQYFDDEQECINVYVELAKTFISKLDEAVYYMLKHCKNDPAVWGLAYAIGSKHIEGQSMSSKARDIGVTKAAISKHARFFVKSLDFPVSPYMRSEESVKVYRAVTSEYHRNKKRGEDK